MAQKRDRLRETLSATGRKQAWLARKTGVSTRTVQRYLAGESDPDESWRKRAADAFDLPVEWLFPSRAVA